MPEEVLVPGEEGEPQEKDMVEVLVEGLDKIPPEPPPEEPEEYRGLDRKALIERMKAAEAKATEALNAANAFSGAVDRLGEKLSVRQPETPAAPVPTPPVLTPEQVKEKLEQGLMENPKEALDTYLAHTMGPVLQQIATNNMTTFRALTRMNKGAQSFDKYAPQIDKWVAGRPRYEQMQSDIYDRAYAAVMMENIDSVVQEKAEEIAKQMVQQQQRQQAPKGGVQYVERGGSASPPPPTARVRRVVLTAEERADADARGIDYNTYAKLFKGVEW